MTEQAANFDPATKNESTRHLSMELIADGARVTALTLDGSRLVVTIEAELSASQVKTSDGALGLAVPPPAAPESKPGSSDQAPLFSAAPRNHPKSEQPDEDFPSAPVKSDYDSGRLAIRKKSAGPITFGSDDPALGLKSPEMDADRAGLVQGLISEATEPEIEPSEPQPAPPAPIAPPPETDSPHPANRWDDSEPVETVGGRETRISSRHKPVPPPEVEPEAAPKPAETHLGEGKPLSFEFAMEAADKGKSEDKPKTEAYAKPEAKTISFGPIDPVDPGDALHADRDDKNILFETPEPASPPPQPIPVARAADGASRLLDINPDAAPDQAEEPITLADFSATSFLETVPAGKMVPPTIAPGPPLAEDDSRWPGEHAPSEEPAPKREKSPLLETVAPGQMLSPATAPNMEIGDDPGGQPLPAPAFEAPRLKAESKRESARLSPPAAPIGFAPAPAPAPDAPAQSEDSNVLGGERHGEPKPAISFGFEESEPAERPEAKPAAAPKEGEAGKGTAKPEAGSTTVLIRYTCPRCKTQGMQAVDKVGTVVNCSNCGKAMRLVMKK